MTRVQELIKKFKFEIIKQNGIESIKTNKRPSVFEVAEIKALKEEIIEEINRQWYEECEKEELEDEKRAKAELEADELRMSKSNFTKKKLTTEVLVAKKMEIIELTEDRSWNSETGNVYCYGECIGTMTRSEALQNKR